MSTERRQEQQESETGGPGFVVAVLVPVILVLSAFGGAVYVAHQTDAIMSRNADRIGS